MWPKFLLFSFPWQSNYGPCNQDIFHITMFQSSLNKSTAQILVTADSVVDSAEQFEFGPIRSSKFQINQPVAFKIQIVQLIFMC